ncbi:MAG: anti-sigma regulatory factor [Leptolyngbya sp. SIO1E4]|nr:anti-sigma regulatory factor [Leptolyngbya sp. SIO1E4]
MLKCEHLVVDSRLEALLKVQRWFKEVFASLEPDLVWVKHYCDRLNIAVAEGFTNAVRHAHASLPPETPISIEISVGGERIDICIWDQGDPFDPNEVREPELGSLLQEGGYGWFLLRRVADQVTYQRRENQNCLEITQYRS